MRTYIRDEFLHILEEDLDQVFIQSDGKEFAENQTTVIYYHATGEVENYPVLFDNPSTSGDTLAEADFTLIQPQIQIQETKLQRPVQKKDQVLVRGKKYFVENFVSDGVGVSTLFLRLK